MFLADRLTFDAPKRTKEGFLAVRAKAARAGVYDYHGCEIDPEGKHFAADQLVKVYRPESEVFDKDAVHSFLLKPITDDHPSVPVTANNWKTHAKGVNAGAIRDGEYLAFDLVLMDAEAIKLVDAGKRELSNGYTSEIEVGDGVAPDGTAYQATQRHIRGNHVAIVDKGRAGPECRIGDTATCDAATVDLLDRLLDDGQTYRATGDKGNLQTDRRDDEQIPRRARDRQDGADKMPHTLIIDGLQVPNVSDEAKAAIEKLQGQVKDAGEAKTKADTDLATAVTDAATKDAEIEKLKKQIEAAKVTPGQLRDAAKAYQAVVDKAKALKVEVADDLDEAAIMKAVVTASLGDKAKDWNDDQIAASFAALTKDVKTNDDEPDQLRSAIRDGVDTKTADAEVHGAYDTMIKDMLEASKPKHQQKQAA